MRTQLLALFSVLNFMIVSIESMSQNIASDSIVWSARSFTDLQTGVTHEIPSTFTSFNNVGIKWVQNNGQSISQIFIKQVHGTWPDVSLNGEIWYDVEIDKQVGIIRIKRMNSTVHLILDFPQWSKGVLRLQYNVSTVTGL
jgi:hypothetical protein